MCLSNLSATVPTGFTSMDWIVYWTKPDTGVPPPTNYTKTYYPGDSTDRNDQVIIQYYNTSSSLKLAVQQGTVDIAYRSLSPTDLNSLKSASGVSVCGT